MKDYVVNNFKKINYQYAMGQLFTCIDLEECRIKTTMFEKYPSISPYTYCGNNPELAKKYSILINTEKRNMEDAVK